MKKCDAPLRELSSCVPDPLRFGKKCDDDVSPLTNDSIHLACLHIPSRLVTVYQVAMLFQGNISLSTVLSTISHADKLRTGKHILFTNKKFVTTADQALYYHRKVCGDSTLDALRALCRLHELRFAKEYTRHRAPTRIDNRRWGVFANQLGLRIA